MELKQSNPHFPRGEVLLLIVPYGIETVVQRPETSVHRLLIVPYGIETHS